MPQSAFITGVSSGLGLALAEAYLARGSRVFGLSRRVPASLMGRTGFSFAAVDLSRLDSIPAAVASLLSGVDGLESVILNAGILSPIGDMADTPMEKLRLVMDVNVWANKPLLDTVFSGGRRVDQVVAISSGAAVSGARGWNGYAISKAALNMFIKLYAAERPQTHFASLAPGLVETDMQAYMRTLPADARYPTVDRLKKAHGTQAMPNPEAAAALVIQAMEKLRDPQAGFKNGDFHDIRKFD